MPFYSFYIITTADTPIFPYTSLAHPYLQINRELSCSPTMSASISSDATPSSSVSPVHDTSLSKVPEHSLSTFTDSSIHNFLNAIENHSRNGEAAAAASMTPTTVDQLLPPPSHDTNAEAGIDAALLANAAAAAASPDDASPDDAAASWHDDLMDNDLLEAEPAEMHAGMLLRLELFNFMCHHKLDIEFGPMVNFIVGPNGSGKSAILIALLMVLGAQPAATGRGQTVSTMVRHGATAGYIKLTLYNVGTDAWRPDTYGPSVTIERRLIAGASAVSKATFVFYDHSGQPVAPLENKAVVELRGIRDRFSLPIDNPAAFVTQDAFKELSSSSPAHMYQWLLKGTRLYDTLQSLRQANHQLDTTAAQLDTTTNELAVLRSKAAVAQREFERIRDAMHIDDELEKAMQDRDWAPYCVAKSELARKRERVTAELDEAASEAAGRVERAQAEKDKVSKRLDKLLDDMLAAEQQRDNRAEAVQTAQEKVAQARHHERHLQEQVQDHKIAVDAAKANHHAAAKKLKPLEAKFGQAEYAELLHQYNKRVVKLTRARDRARENIDKFGDQAAELDVKLAEHEKLLSQRTAEVKMWTDREAHTQKLIAQLRAGASHQRSLQDSFALRSMDLFTEAECQALQRQPSIVQALAVTVRKRQGEFSKPPVGPLALYMRCLPEYSAEMMVLRQIQSMIHTSDRLLHVFLVNSPDDIPIMEECVEQALGRSGSAVLPVDMPCYEVYPLDHAAAVSTLAALPAPPAGTAELLGIEPLLKAVDISLPVVHAYLADSRRLHWAARALNDTLFQAAIATARRQQITGRVEQGKKDLYTPMSWFSVMCGHQAVYRQAKPNWLQWPDIASSVMADSIMLQPMQSVASQIADLQNAAKHQNAEKTRCNSARLDAQFERDDVLKQRTAANNHKLAASEEHSRQHTALANMALRRPIRKQITSEQAQVLGLAQAEVDQAQASVDQREQTLAEAKSALAEYIRLEVKPALEHERKVVGEHDGYSPEKLQERRDVLHGQLRDALQCLARATNELSRARELREEQRARFEDKARALELHLKELQDKTGLAEARHPDWTVQDAKARLADLRALQAVAGELAAGGMEEYERVLKLKQDADARLRERSVVFDHVRDLHAHLSEDCTRRVALWRGIRDSITQRVDRAFQQHLRMKGFVGQCSVMHGEGRQHGTGTLCMQVQPDAYTRGGLPSAHAGDKRRRSALASMQHDDDLDAGSSDDDDHAPGPVVRKSARLAGSAAGQLHHVVVDDSRTKAAASQAHDHIMGLSGGEKSVCCLSLLLAVGSAVECAVRVVDELDVFCDESTRVILINLAVAVACRDVGRQSLFITPHDVRAGVKAHADDVRVFMLEQPRAGARRS